MQNTEINQIIQQFLNKIRSTEYFSKIEFIILYGSSIGEYYYEDSDIDLCVYVQSNKKALARMRLNLLKNFEEKFDIQMFQLLPLFVQIEVLKGEVVYAKEESVLYEIAYQTIEEYEDFYPLYLDYINR